ncbi:MAG: hypothetical protein JOZ55_03625 [Alphaproteobacteria bacterium]|nr:hypothetical protein [Alphaproteobacteria bacterium]
MTKSRRRASSGLAMLACCRTILVVSPGDALRGVFDNTDNAARADFFPHAGKRKRDVRWA